MQESKRAEVTSCRNGVKTVHTNNRIFSNWGEWKGGRVKGVSELRVVSYCHPQFFVRSYGSVCMVLNMLGSDT